MGDSEAPSAGVKALVETGITRIPKMFVRSPEELSQEANYRGQSNNKNIHIPLIDLRDIGNVADGREKIVNELRRASGEWGFFQLVNHGVPANVMDGMIDGIRKFHELDPEVKKEFASRDWINKVRDESKIDINRSKPAAHWRDTMTINLLFPNQEPDLPSVCKGEMLEYINHVTKLGESLFDLLSEALGLKVETLREMGCAKVRTLPCHYYPACPEPDLTMGISFHTDPTFLTILLQDQIGGLQCFHDNQWIDVQPVPGAFVVNIGDLLQIVSNDKFKSVEHRVLANTKGPRISVACFFNGVAFPPKTYGPIKELVSEETPALYNEFTFVEYMAQYFKKQVDQSALEYFRI